MLIFEGKGLRCRSLFGKWNDQDSEDAYSAGVLILVAKSARNFTRRKSPTLKPRQPRAVERDVWEIDGSGTHWCKAFLVGTSCVCIYIYTYVYVYVYMYMFMYMYCVCRGCSFHRTSPFNWS